MFDAIKSTKVNVKDERYKLKYNRGEDDVQDNNVERFNCNYDGCKQLYKPKGEFVHFISHFTGEFTYKRCNVTFTHKSILKHHLLINKNKRQFKCSY